MQIMKSVVRIMQGSPLVDMKIKEIEDKFGVKVTTQYNPFPAEQNAKKAKPDERVYPNLCLEIEGNYEAMRKFSLASVDF